MASAVRGQAVAVLVLGAGLLSCAAPPGEAADTLRRDEGLYEAEVRDHVQAMQEGMARARLDLARRAIRRLMQGPG